MATGAQAATYCPTQRYEWLPSQTPTPHDRKLAKMLAGLALKLHLTFTRYTIFRPETLVGGHRRFVKRWWWMLVVAGKRRATERPRLDTSVEQIIIDMKPTIQAIAADESA